MNDLVARIAARHLASQDEFAVGDEILYGKYKNKRGVVVRFFEDERGVPSVEIEPVPKGRKQNKVMGLYKIWGPKKSTKSAAGQGWVGAAMIVRNDKGQVMLLKRGETAPWMPGKWNLPGGTVDEGEAPEEAAIREAKEEVEIDVKDVKHVQEVPYEGGVAHFYSAGSFEGTPNLTWENTQLDWVDPDKVGDYDLIPGIEGAISKVTGVPERGMPAQEEGFQEFLDQRYEGGSGKIPNPDKQTGHDEITVNYLLKKHPRSSQALKLQREFAAWKTQSKKASMQREACIIAGRRFGDSLCLIKNRDRAYDAELEIVHVDKDGTEMAVIFDTITGYLEGVNEYGIAVVNTTLMVVRDEAEGNPDKKKPPVSKDGPKIYRALACDSLEDAVESLCASELRGHTFVADGKRLISIECSKENPARVTELDPDLVNARTNHGVGYPGAGYTHGEDYISSIVRRWEAQKRLQDVKLPEAAAVALVEAIHDADSPYNPVRVTDNMRTTSQLTINTTHPQMLLYLIPGHAKVMRTRNLLPDQRKPKIPVRVFRYKSKMEDREAELGKEATVQRVATRYTETARQLTSRDLAEPDEATIKEWLVEHISDKAKMSRPRMQALKALEDHYPYLKPPSVDHVYRGLRNIRPGVEWPETSDPVRDKSWSLKRDPARRFARGDWTRDPLVTGKVGVILTAKADPKNLLLNPDLLAELPGVGDVMHPVWKEKLSKALRDEQEVLALGALEIDSSEQVPMIEKSAAAARYKSKKKVKTKDGDEMTVYEYSDRQVADRNRKKAERIEKLRKQMEKLQTKVRKDVQSKDEKTRDLALAVGLMDETFERIGNDGSAKEGHFGVTTWRIKHVKFAKGSATVSYIGKSGVGQKKKITNPRIVSALKKACGGKSPNDCVLSVSASDVNEYPKPLDITAKDIRGFHANREMKEQLSKVRKGKLPEDPKERKTKLKEEFKAALEATASAVGHEPSTLRGQYLVPGLEDEYMKDGTVRESHTKHGSLRTAALLGTQVERHILSHAEFAPVLVGRKRQWWVRNAPSLYRIAREQEKTRPSIEGMQFDPDLFTILWYEDEEGNRLPDVEDWEGAPVGAEYQHSQFPNVLRSSILRLNEDGTSTDIGSLESSYPEELVNAMVRSGDWDVGDAITTAAKSCERCLNVLLNHYGSDDGYPFDSEEYWRCGTRCDMCEHVDNSPEEPLRLNRMLSRSAAPTYDSYVKRKRREGGPTMPREQWEAKVLGRGSEEVPVEHKPPSREDWDEHRKAMMEEHGLSKFHVAYRPQDNHLSVSLISVADESRGKGHASAAMKDMLSWADSNGATVTLSPTSEFGSSKKRLEKWYRSMGFVPNKGRNKDFRFQDAMIRTPQSKTATKTHAEKEDEAVGKMLRSEPKLKPPRYDLRDNRTLDEEDEEDLGGGDDGDRDLSMKWNKVAHRVAFRWAIAPSTSSSVRVALRKFAEPSQQPPQGDSPQPQKTPQGGPSFEEWVKNQKFKHPETGNDVGFSSLPPEEQTKIREKWKGNTAPEESGKTKGKGDEESNGPRTKEDVQVELSSARDEMRDIEAQMSDLQKEIKGMRSSLEQQKALAEQVKGPAKKQLNDAVLKLQREIGRKQDELDDQKDDFDAAQERVKELKAERKDPGFVREKKQKKLQEQHARKVQQAVGKAQGILKKVLGKDSQLSPDLGSQVIEALNNLDESQVESFSIDFQDTLHTLMKQDPASEEALDVAARAAKFGDLQGLSDPTELARRLAHLSYAQNIVANPMNIAGTPVGVTEMDDAKYAERAQDAFKQFQKLPSSLRRGAAEKVRKALEGIDPETHRAQELNAILTGMDVAHIAATGDALPGRPQPSKGMAQVIKKMVEKGDIGPLFETTEDFFADQARSKMEKGLEDMDPLEIGELATGGDPKHGYADMVRLLQSPETPNSFKVMMTDYLIQDILNDQWGDRAVRDTMEAAGVQDADDPDVRAGVMDEAKQRMKPRMEEMLGARERISEAEKEGRNPDPEDLAIIEGVIGDKGTGLREQAKALLDTIKDKFKKLVVSPATAVLNHFVQTGEQDVLEQETIPHPDVQAQEPRPKEERAEARADEQTAPSSPREQMVQRVRLKAERAKLKAQRAKAPEDKKGDYDAKIGDLDSKIEALSKSPEGGSPSKDREKPDAKEDENHGPGDVWQTEQGNWRAKNEKGTPKTFKSREKADQHSKGKEPESKGGEAPGKEFSGDFNIPVEDRGPTKFAAEVANVWITRNQSTRVAHDWLAHIRSIHPDSPKRPLVVFDVA